MHKCVIRYITLCYTIWSSSNFVFQNSFFVVFINDVRVVMEYSVAPALDHVNHLAFIYVDHG